MAYQLCPKCQGQGSVSKPPWLSAEQQAWSSTQTSWVCDVCNGAKIILSCNCRLTNGATDTENSAVQHNWTIGEQKEH